MLTKLRLLRKIIGFQAFRTLGFPKLMPMNVTVAVTNKCTSLCRTCNLGRIYVKDPHVADNDLKPEEYEKIFKSIGKNNVYWFVFSGAEPFMRRDIVEIVKHAYNQCQPNVIVLPTNSLPSDIPSRVEELLRHCKNSIINVNLSLDGIGKDHDEIRGIKGNFERVVNLFGELNKLKPKYKNFELNIHTVVSRFNVKKIPKLHEFVIAKIKPDAHITEIAENKAEIENLNLEVTPGPNDYETTIDMLSSELRKEKFKGFTKFKQVSRLIYYGLVKEIFRRKTQVIPCYAAINECQISPTGEVWTCSVLGKSLGSLREENYNFRKIWKSQKAKMLRKSIKNKECWCPVANISYTNMLCHYPSALKMLYSFLLR